jgi:hypothetical protein
MVPHQWDDLEISVLRNLRKMGLTFERIGKVLNREPIQCSEKLAKIRGKKDAGSATLSETLDLYVRRVQTRGFNSRSIDPASPSPCLDGNRGIVTRHESGKGSV